VGRELWFQTRPYQAFVAPGLNSGANLPVEETFVGDLCGRQDHFKAVRASYRVRFTPPSVSTTAVIAGQSIRPRAGLRLPWHSWFQCWRASVP
jgi:hypothetical protein